MPEADGACQWWSITGHACEMEDLFNINGQYHPLNISVNTIMGEMCVCEFHLNQMEKSGMGTAVYLEDVE